MPQEARHGSPRSWADGPRVGHRRCLGCTGRRTLIAISKRQHAIRGGPTATGVNPPRNRRPTTHPPITDMVAPKIAMRSVCAQALDGQPPPSIPPTEDDACNRVGTPGNIHACLGNWPSSGAGSLKFRPSFDTRGSLLGAASSFQHARSPTLGALNRSGRSRPKPLETLDIGGLERRSCLWQGRPQTKTTERRQTINGVPFASTGCRSSAQGGQGRGSMTLNGCSVEDVH